MTPEEREQKIDFIIESQASSAVRMRQVEGELSHQRENIHGLMTLAQQLLELARIERETRKAEIEAEREARKAGMEAEREARKAGIEAEREARKAEIEAEREARKAGMEAERAKVDSIEEMTKILRELLEANLRRPEEPPQTDS